jgi:hypothetical protein
VDVELFGMLDREWPGYEQKAAALDLQPSGIEPKPRPETNADHTGGRAKAE